MIFTGTIKLADNSLIRFYENGEILRVVKGQNARMTLNETIMHLTNTPSYTHDSKSFYLDGKIVSYAKFKAALDKLEPPKPRFKDEDYVELYIEHELREVSVEVEEDVPTVTAIEVDALDDDEEEAAVINPEQAENWWS